MHHSLSECCTRIDYGFTQSSSSDEVGPHFLRITDIEPECIDWKSVPYCQASPEDERKYALNPGDIVIARTGASTGNSKWIASPNGSVFASYLVRLTSRPEINSRYLSYVLKSARWYHHVSSIAHSKSAQPNMSASAMGDFTFDVHDPKEQQAIAEVLGALDDKIAANRKLVTTIDEFASAVYKQAATDEQPLTDLARFVNGRNFTKNATGDGRVVVRIAELNSGIGGSTVRNRVEDTADDNLARPGDILFAWSGSLTLHRWTRPEALINQHIFKVVPKTEVPYWLAYQAVATKLPEFKGIAADKATTMGHIQRRHLDTQTATPTADEVEALDPLMTSLWDRAVAADRESQTLAQLRDTLLPALMDGRIRVKDAQETVEEVL
ncbi:MAG: restriction endonuclease subunit S [Acidipropionibacterium acidipropionici]|uniref:restriction endonuclease subunit S n=1 Tax=Acidipropionibacterium acidipropionici TaxID=1748 RepID=UPI002F3553CE